MFTKILIFPIFLSLACFSFNENLLYVITENETIRLNLSQVFIGNNIMYTTTQTDFQIIQPFNEYDRIELPEQIYPISFKPLLNINRKWMNQFAYMSENFISVNITYSNPQINLNSPKFKNVLHLGKPDSTLSCFDFDYYRDDSFMIICQKETQNLIYIHNKNGDLLNQIELENFINIESISITNTQEYFYKLETNQTHSVLAIYKWNEKQTTLNLYSQISNNTISILFSQLQSLSVQLKICKYKILNDNKIYFLDQNLGLFKYQDNKTTLIINDKIIYFDIEEENGYLIYLQTQKIIIHYKQHYIHTINLDTKVDDKAKIHISGQYIILHNTGHFSSFSIYSGQLLQKVNSEGIITYLSSQNYLITLSNEFSHFYLLTNGYLLLNTDNIESRDKMINFQIQGKDTHGVCYVTINLQIIQENQDILIINEDKSPIIIGSPIHTQELKLMISGPNQNYFCISNCSIQHVIDYPFTIQLQDKLIFQDIIKLDHINYYLLQQFQKSDQLIINKCELKSQFVCSSYKTIEMKINLNNQIFQWQLLHENVYFVIQENSFTLSLQTINLSIKKLEFEKSVKKFMFYESTLYVIFENQINFYQNIIVNSEYILIDDTFINQCAFSINWQPQRIYINTKGDTLFIINHNNLLITNLFTNFYIKYYLNVEIAENDHLAISDYTFILIKDNILFEYNYYQDVYLIHKIPTYQKSLFQPINAKQIKDYFLIQTENQEILIYNFNTQAHNSLKLQILISNINLEIQKQQILFSPFSSDLKLFVLFYSNQLILKMIELYPIIQYEFEYNNHNYIQDTTAVIKVSNDKHSLQLNQKIQQINTFTSIKLLEKELKEENKVYLQKQEQKIPLVVKWYEGQVIDFIVESEIKDVVTIQNLLEKTANKLQDKLQFNNIIRIDNETTILQGSSSILQLDSQFQVVTLINLDVNPQFKCIQTIKDQLFYYTLCNSLTNSYLHVTKYTDGFPLGFLYQFDDLAIKIGIINKKIAFLTDYTLKLGDITFEDEKLQIKNILQINSTYLKLKNPFHAIDFDITETVGDEYIIQIIDLSGLVAILRGMYSSNNFIVFNIKTFDIKELLIKHNLTILNDTTFIFIKNLCHQKSFLLNINFIIITNNAGSYGIRLTYDDETNPQLEFMIIQYGFWQTQRFDIDNNVITISYKKENKVFIGIYRIKFDQQYYKFKQYMIESGFQIDQITEDSLFFFLKNNYLIVNSQDQMYQEYYINDYVYFTVKGAQDRQHVNITARNDFSSGSLNYIINYHIEKEPSNTWWIVLVSVCGGAIFIAVCFYLYKRMHPVKSVSSVLLE